MAIGSAARSTEEDDDRLTLGLRHSAMHAIVSSLTLLLRSRKSSEPGVLQGTYLRYCLPETLGNALVETWLKRQAICVSGLGCCVFTDVTLAPLRPL